MEHLRLLGLNPYWLDLTSICSRRIINEEYGLNPYWLDLTILIQYKNKDLAERLNPYWLDLTLSMLKENGVELYVV